MDQSPNAEIYLIESQSAESLKDGERSLVSENRETIDHVRKINEQWVDVLQLGVVKLGPVTVGGWADRCAVLKTESLGVWQVGAS